VITGRNFKLPDPGSQLLGQKLAVSSVETVNAVTGIDASYIQGVEKTNQG
jgi:hypothetical protein